MLITDTTNGFLHQLDSKVTQLDEKLAEISQLIKKKKNSGIFTKSGSVDCFLKVVLKFVKAVLNIKIGKLKQMSSGRINIFKSFTCLREWRSALLICQIQLRKCPHIR